MRKELVISYCVHCLFIIVLFLSSAFSKPKISPEKVYMVRIVAAPQPIVPKAPEIEQTPPVEPEPKPAVEAIPEPKKVPPKPKPVKEQEKEQAKPTPAPKVTSPTGQGHITVDGPDFSDDFYLNLIYMKVYRNWLPPASGRSMSATVYFKILKNGEVKDAKIEKHSGQNDFDQRALRTILSSSPFPELPETYTGDHLGIHFEFVHNP